MKKPWYISKACWGGVLIFIGAGLEAIGIAFGKEIAGLGLALSVVGIRTAKD